MIIKLLKVQFLKKQFSEGLIFNSYTVFSSIATFELPWIQTVC